MKKVLMSVYAFIILLSLSVYAADYEEIYSKAVDISTALENGHNVQESLGEAVIMMIENDILKTLDEEGETEYAAELKASADAALDAAGAGAEDAREKAIDFCDKLIGMQKIFPVGFTAIKLTTEGQYVTVTELEHYALTVNNTQLSDTPTTVTVEFCDKDKNAITLTDVYILGAKDKSSSSSMSRGLVTGDNVFNFTTPKNCKFVKVSTTDSKKFSVTLEVTNEVINNGSVVRATSDKGTSGWRVLTGSWQDVANDYFSLSVKTSTNLKQNLILKEGSTYRLKFKYAQSCPEGATMTSKAPQLQFNDLGATVVSLPEATNYWEDAKVLTSAPAASDWKEYEAYYVAKESNTGNDSLEGLVNISMYPRCYENGGATEYYDDFSLEEVDEGTYMWYLKADGVSVSGKSIAKTIRYHYVQDVTGKTQKLIHAKYENDTISTVEVIEVGKDVSVGESRDYDITIDKESESKIFLWDGTTLVPQRLPIENYVIIN